MRATELRSLAGKIPETPEKPVCDFCGDPEPIWAFPCEDYNTGVPDVELTETLGIYTTTGSLGGWAACNTCRRFIKDGDRKRLARRAAVAVRNRKGATAASLNVLQKAAEGVHSDFWKHRSGEPRLMTEEERNTRPLDPEVEFSYGERPPVPGWLGDMALVADAEESPTIPDSKTTIDGESRRRSS